MVIPWPHLANLRSNLDLVNDCLATIKLALYVLLLAILTVGGAYLAIQVSGTAKSVASTAKEVEKQLKAEASRGAPDLSASAWESTTEQEAAAPVDFATCIGEIQAADTVNTSLASHVICHQKMYKSLRDMVDKRYRELIGQLPVETHEALVKAHLGWLTAHESECLAKNPQREPGDAVALYLCKSRAAQRRLGQLDELS